MGFPLKANIFKQGTREHKYFASFPVQVAVLFSPDDRKFVEAFRDIFINLDQLTGDSVAFFAVLDPPEDWIKVARTRSWWQEYQGNIGQIGFSYEDSVLIQEIARLFRVAWSSLPSIVVGTDLWTGERVIFPTSVWDIERQLEALTQLVTEWGQPNIDHIYQTLSELIGSEPEYHPPSDGLRHRFSKFYGVLDTTRGGYEINSEEYRRSTQAELQAVSQILDQLRQGRNEELSLDSSATEQILEDITGRLVAPATVAMRIWEDLQARYDIPLIDLMDEESVVMVKQALRIGNFLEVDIEGSFNPFNSLPNSTPKAIQRPPRDRTQINRNAPRKKTSKLEDFTPGAQGAWKAFEREINLSLIQAARASRNVKMPEFFSRYDPNPRVNGKVKTGNKNKDINQPDLRSKRTGRHRFLPLGDALFVIKSLHNCSTEQFDTVVVKCLNSHLPSHLLNAWERIHQIRNQASHTEPLNREDYQQLLQDALSPNVLKPLMQIKQFLSS